MYLFKRRSDLHAILPCLFAFTNVFFGVVVVVGFLELFGAPITVINSHGLENSIQQSVRALETLSEDWKRPSCKDKTL